MGYLNIGRSKQFYNLFDLLNIALNRKARGANNSDFFNPNEPLC